MFETLKNLGVLLKNGHVCRFEVIDASSFQHKLPGVVLWSRRGNGFTSRLPEIVSACENLPPETLIDSEVIAIDKTGRYGGAAMQN
jgi:hypothetical protein